VAARITATTTEISEASQARMRITPSSANNTSRGRIATSEDSPSESETGL
jgi:hypothetical protein